MAGLPAQLRLAVFDLAGTTLDDLVDGEPLAVVAIRTAFARVGLEVDAAAVTAHRGLEKREAIRQLCRELRLKGETVAASFDEEEFVDQVHGYFKDAVEQALRQGPLREIPGTSGVFKALQSRGIRVVVGSGFAEETVRRLVERLGWQVDGLVSANRPKPDSIFKAMKMTGVEDGGQVVKVGDTVADVEEGRNAGVWTVAVLTGTQSEAKLRLASPDFVLQSVADLLDLLPAAGDRSAAEVAQASTAREGFDNTNGDIESSDVPAQPALGGGNSNTTKDEVDHVDVGTDVPVP